MYLVLQYDMGNFMFLMQTWVYGEGPLWTRAVAPHHFPDESVRNIWLVPPFSSTFLLLPHLRYNYKLCHLYLSQV